MNPMPRVSLRFYEEPNDLLPGSLRKHTFEKEFTGTQSVKHLIENLGVPHTEVEIILINAQSVDLSYPLQEGDRISVYPMFKLLDISPLLRLRIKPMRDPRFMADAHLSKLSRYLRLLGFDCLFFNDACDRNLARISVEQGRVLLASDRGLLMRRNITHGCFIHATEPRQHKRVFDLVKDFGTSQSTKIDSIFNSLLSLFQSINESETG
ncbi:MAG: Mut7-C ubiquitin/RNAse domain-containing protein [Candidatus Thiodiazotropha sp. (ex Lucinoma aequizonata)]|nr:Mut7-C ubiquitin/RNAse domain-containing protein [Candidatus Thiodiazotropha sp. (ex Lucinoma aequizonata)]MCU7908610.1 Mut7-C ubiquitin/RNAse domain-containing protein [Candidatus Thiodiazotropha sp. (ex Lucinoma aequizonata)]